METNDLIAIGQKATAVFDRLLLPLGRDAFLTRFWGKSFLRLAGQQGKFEFLISWEELNSILEQHHLKPPRLKLLKDNKQIDPSLYLAINDQRSKLRPAAFINQLAEGATLILDCVDELAPAVGHLADSWQEVLRSRTNVNLYAGWRTQTGLDLHWDVQDTMILQISGRKHWTVYQPTRLHPLREDVAPGKPTGEPFWEGVVEDGDLLYLPRGWWHVARPLDEPSLHLTVTIAPADGMDLLRWAIKQLLSDPEVRMNVPHLASESERKDYVEKMRERLMEVWSDDVLERFLAEWEMTVPLRPQLRLPFAPFEAAASLSRETNIRLASSRRIKLFPHSQNGTVSYVTGGIRGACSTDLVPALELLSGYESHSVNELCSRLSHQDDSPKLIVLLTALAIKGAVHIEAGESCG